MNIPGIQVLQAVKLVPFINNDHTFKEYKIKSKEL